MTRQEAVSLRGMAALLGRVWGFEKRKPVKYHENSDCCMSVATALMSGLVVAGENDGCAGVLAHVSSVFKWGGHHCEYLCDAYAHRDGLACETLVSVMEYLLLAYPEYLENEKLMVVDVHVILKKNHHLIESSIATFTEAGSGIDFIEEEGGLAYHEAMGLVEMDGTLRIVDICCKSGARWYMPCQDQSAEDNGMVAFRYAAPEDVRVSVRWQGHWLKNNEWTTFIPELAPLGIRLLHTEHPCPPVEELTSRYLLPSFTQAPDIRQSEADGAGVHVFISCIDMNGSAPAPGVFIGRCLRAAYPAMRITGLNYNDVTSGQCDPVFDDTLLLNANSLLKCPRRHWARCMEFLQSGDRVFYIPSVDSEIKLLSAGYSMASEAEQRIADDRVLAPLNEESVDDTAKPFIRAASHLGMECPPTLLLSDTATQLDVYDWCVRHRYPVVVKGGEFEAVVCQTYADVLAVIQSLTKRYSRDGIHIQERVLGFNRGIMCAAYKGKMLSCVMMTKMDLGGGAGKSWGATYSEVPVELREGLAKAMEAMQWTGACEVEHVNTLSGDNYVIDWNPRFPAWVHGASYSSVNSPAELLAAASGLPPPPSPSIPSLGVYVTRTVVDIPAPAMQAFIHCGPETQVITPSGTCTAGKGSHLQTMIDAASAPITSPPTALNNTMSAIDAVDSRNDSRDDSLWTDNSSVSSKDTSSSCRIDKSSFPSAMPSLDALSLRDSDGSTCSDISAQKMSHSVEKWMGAVASVCDAAEDLMAKPSNLATPCYVLSDSVVRDNMVSIRDSLVQEVSEVAPGVEVQMCVSIKTQPHKAVMKEARAQGYLAEGISASEIIAALDIGYDISECVLNGPAKWFIDPTRGSMAGGGMTELFKYAGQGGLKAIFADNVEELEALVDWIVDEKCPLKCEYVGVRVVPGCGAQSRFGVALNNVDSVSRISTAFRKLPKSQKIGLHHHYAQSTLGIDHWVGIATGYVTAASMLECLSGRNISILDFGGGWSSNALNDPMVTSRVGTVVELAAKCMPHLEMVWFEPGKSLTENAGALITRVEAVRTANISNKLLDSQDSSPNRAAIIDGCISDMGSLVTHPHPVLYRPKHGGSFNPLPSGTDSIDGRICMEFDRVSGPGVELPEDIAKGDWIMVAFAGAYDITMAYPFGDGKGRENMHVVAA